MTGAAIAIFLGFCLLFLAWRQRYQINTGKRANTNSRKLRPQHPYLERKLLKLLGGKQQTADRLIQQSRLRYPDKSADWHWEKAIYDLERDRWR
jgi:phosphatidylserine/phosphatidylglycerophosphate/cardiolipin synthase-like enzyme